MAGDWIKMRRSLLGDPRVVRIASALNADRFRTIGGLFSAWCLFDEQTEDGKLDGYTPQAFDEVVGMPGICVAMASVGWIEIREDSLVAVEFSQHNGQTAKRRAQENVRKMSARDADKRRTKSGTREEKRREENNTHTHTVRNDVPKDIPERIKIAFDRWCDFRLAIDGRKPDPISSEANLMKLCRLGEDKAERDIEFSILKSAKTILDSDNDFEKIAAERRNGSARPPERKRKTVQEMLDKAFPDRHKQPGGTGDG